MRIEGWESKLTDYIAAAKPFQWGENDCALWAAKWVAICTLDDHTKGWRGAYKTQKGAAMAIRKRGFLSVSDIADHHLSRIPIATAQRGDLVLHPSDSLGICNGVRSVFITNGGLLVEHTLSCKLAWRVQ